MTKKAFLTFDDLAQMFDVSPDTIRRWEDRGRFPAGVRFGPRCVRWRADAIEKFVREREEAVQKAKNQKVEI